MKQIFIDIKARNMSVSMLRTTRYLVFVSCIVGLAGGREASALDTLESLGKTEGVYSVIYVKTNTAQQANVIDAFHKFAKTEKFQCAPVDNALQPTVHCRRNAIDLAAIRDSGRIKITSMISAGHLMYSVLSPEERARKDSKAFEKALQEAKVQFKSFNNRLAEYLRSLYEEAVE